MEKNIAKGVDLLEKLIEAGDASIMYLLGLRYITGFDLEEDVVRGVDLLEKAVDSGYVNAMEILGGC